MTKTLTLVGELATRSTSQAIGADGAAGVARAQSYDVRGWMPGVIRLNDGRLERWLPLDEPVVIEYENDVWAVSYPERPYDSLHNYRLAWQPTGYPPEVVEPGTFRLADGSVLRLEPGVVYEVRLRGDGARAPHLRWDLFRR